MGWFFWLPEGKKLKERIQSYLRTLMSKHQYNEVESPFLYNSCLWEKSGHAEMFGQNMMHLDLDDAKYALKPMNCPAHALIFKSDNRSYKDLPVKYCEFGFCHRYESSGSLNGLFRARGFRQDDAHVFCSADQLTETVTEFCRMVIQVYQDFGFTDVHVAVSTRPDKYIGSIDTWNKSEKILQDILADMKLDYQIQSGEGAFYGPKIEFAIKDLRGRQWQCGTVQADFSLAQRLDVTYTNKDGDPEAPIVVHHAVLGSIERFMAILLENSAGALPWAFTPHHVVVLPMHGADVSYFVEQMGNYRYCVDTTSHTLNYKKKYWISRKVPFQVVIGQKEIESKSVSVSRIGTKEVINYSIEEFLQVLSSMGDIV